MDASPGSMILGKWAFAIVNGELTHPLRAVFLYPISARNQWSQMVEQSTEDDLLRANHVRQLLRLLQHISNNRNPLLLIGVQQCGRSVAFHRISQLPGEIDHVLDSGVHPLRSRWTVDMSGV